MCVWQAPLMSLIYFFWISFANEVKLHLEVASIYSFDYSPAVWQNILGLNKGGEKTSER